LETIKAVVQKVVQEGKHGPFAVATSDQLEGSVTFSLEPTVWEEDEWPEEGMVVLLKKLRQKRAGWRAKTGRFFRPSDEQTANRKEHDMLERMKAFIESFRTKWFPTDDDKTWKEWVDYKERETRDLIGLFGSNVRDGFKRRAIFLLLVPEKELNPIYWTEEVGKFYSKPEFLKVLNPDLLGYATELIVEFCTMLKPAHCDKSKYYRSVGDGFNIYMTVPDKYHDALCFYNDCILLLLTILPEEQCERIFPLFSLRDISAYSDLESSSGYEPFRHLLYSKADEKWKKRADNVMRQVIENELAGRAKPRESWENALCRYADIIDSQSYGGSTNYSIDLYADQINFLVSNNHYGHKLISSWIIVRIFKILSADTYKQIRYRVARFMVFGNKEEFRVWNDEILQCAETILSEFGQDDKGLAQRIQSAIEEGKKQSADYEKKQADAKKAEEDILSQMR